MTSRPPVVAQTRFSQLRSKLPDSSLGERFSKIHELNLWGSNESVSGLGSEREATRVLKDTLPQLFSTLQIKSILDAPCGDASWIEGCVSDLEMYVGADIVPSLIEANGGKEFARQTTTFQVADLCSDPLPKTDLVLCRDCLVHLSLTNILRALNNIRMSGASWLLTTHFPDTRENVDIDDGDWRPLNLMCPPFGLPEPTLLINEQCEEANGGYRDKSLALWNINDIAGI